MRTSVRWMVLGSACALLACGDETQSKGEPGILELGGGEVRFEMVADAQHLPLHAGTQGGHHVWLSMRVQGLDPEQVLFVLDVTPEGPSPLAHTEVELDFVPVPDRAGVFEFVGWPARVLSAECAVNKSVRLNVRLEDQQGRTAEGELRIVADPPKAGFPTPCEQPGGS